MLLQARRLLGPIAECCSRADPPVPARFNHPSPLPDPFDVWDFWKAWWNADSGEEERGGRGWSGKVLGSERVCRGSCMCIYIHVYIYILFCTWALADAACCVGEHDWTTASRGSLCLGDFARLCIRLSMYVKWMFVQLPPRRLIIFWMSPPATIPGWLSIVIRFFSLHLPDLVEWRSTLPRDVKRLVKTHNYSFIGPLIGTRKKRKSKFLQSHRRLVAQVDNLSAIALVIPLDKLKLSQ